MGPIPCARGVVVEAHARHFDLSWESCASEGGVPDVEVISLNSAVELTQLQREGYDTGVRFVQAHRDGRGIVGKPLIRIYNDKTEH